MLTHTFYKGFTCFLIQFLAIRGVYRSRVPKANTLSKLLTYFLDIANQEREFVKCDP